MKTQDVTRALGWFSIGLGIIELVAPRQIGRSIGLRGHTGMLRAFGLREIVSGLGILSQRRPAGWMWSRVAGDILDFAALAAAMPEARPKDRGKITAAAAAVAGVAVADLVCSKRLTDARRSTEENGALSVHFKKTITINRPAEELYRFWRELQNLPVILPHLRSVQSKAEDQSKSLWVAEAPMGGTVEWDAELTEDRAGEVIAWQSLPGSDVDTRGSVRFQKAPGRRGTIVTVEMEYRPPAGAFGSKIAKLFGDAPEQELTNGLRHFKQLMETGEIITTEGQPAARGRGQSKYEGVVRQWAAS